MRMIGIVRWKTTDKEGVFIAGVEPMYEVEGDGDWRRINATEEFPTQGRIFWRPAQDAIKNAIFFFRPEGNPGHKLRCRVSDPHPAVEVIDLRDLGPPHAVKAALAPGIWRLGLCEGLSLVRCASDILVGPIKLVKRANGLFTFEASKPDRIPFFAAESVGELQSLPDGQVKRTILAIPLRQMSIEAKGYVDWADDKNIFRRALTAAVTRAKRSGTDLGLTKRMIDAAAEAVTREASSTEIELERYRLERARELCSKAGYISQLATGLCDELIQHPAVAESLDTLRTHMMSTLEEQMRADVEVSLAARRRELVQLDVQVSDSRTALNQARDELTGLQQELADARARADREAVELDAEISRRLSEAIQRPSSVLADVAILRGFLGSSPASGIVPSAGRANTQKFAWTAAASIIDERVALQRALFSAFKGLGIAPALSMRLHAAVIAKVMPVVSGSGGLAALSAYGHVVCGGRVALIHVTPNQLRPLSLDCGELGQIAETARPIFAPSMVVFEGANRSPAEAYLTPFLQIVDALPIEGESGLSTSVAQSGVAPPSGLYWAATAVAGASTVPLTRDLWAHSVSIHIETRRRGHLPSSLPTEVTLSSDLMLPGEPPDGMIEEILETLPLARENEPCLHAFAAALARFEPDPQKIKLALLECSILPLVASCQDDKFREDSLDCLRLLVGDADDFESLVALEQRLRWRLA